VTNTSGAPMLILVYRQGSSSSNTISSITGTAAGSSYNPQQIVTQQFGSNSVDMVEAWTVAGTVISNGTLTVTFAAANNVTTTIDVVAVSGSTASDPLVASTGNTNISGTTVSGGSLSGVSASDTEVFFAGLATSTTMSTPSGYTALDAPATGSSALHGSWYSSSASSTGTSTTVGTSTAWGTIEVAIAPS
jgi:hypothetical protein